MTTRTMVMVMVVTVTVMVMVTVTVTHRATAKKAVPAVVRVPAAPRRKIFRN